MVYRGDPWFSANFDHCPMLWFPLACAFWLGLAVMLTRLRESSVFVSLLILGAFIGLAGLNREWSPNFKLSRTAMLMSAVVAGIGCDFLARSWARQLGRQTIYWGVLVLVMMASFTYGSFKLGQVMSHPLSWWFHAFHPMKPREDYVFAHPEYRFWGIGVALTDVRPGAPLTPATRLREILETPSDGRDVVFLFPAGRTEWWPTVQNLVKIWQTVYPGGEVQMHAVPVTGGQWPAFISYRLPAAQYWWLPPVAAALDAKAQAGLRWQRAELLARHSLTMEAWREALQAARIEPKYYEQADKLLGNDRGREGRLGILIRGRLWNDARTELELWSQHTQLTERELAWKKFLDAHGLALDVYSTLQPVPRRIATIRQYWPEIAVGHIDFILGPHFNLSTQFSGQLYVPQDGRYSFMDVDHTASGAPQELTIDGKVVLAISRNRFDCRGSAPIWLTRGMHHLTFTCPPYFLKSPFLCGLAKDCVPDELNILYGFSTPWRLKWKFEQGPMVPIPPEFLYALGAGETPVPPMP